MILILHLTKTLICLFLVYSAMLKAVFVILEFKLFLEHFQLIVFIILGDHEFLIRIYISEIRENQCLLLLLIAQFRSLLQCELVQKLTSELDVAVL